MQVFPTKQEGGTDCVKETTQDGSSWPLRFPRQGETIISKALFRDNESWSSLLGRKIG